MEDMIVIADGVTFAFNGVVEGGCFHRFDCFFFCFKVGVMNLVLVHDYESFQKVIWMSFKKFQIMI